MIVNSIKIRILVILTLLLLTSIGCDKRQIDTVEYDGKNMQVNLTLPQVLVGTAITDLLAFATLDGGARHDLTVDPITNTVSGEITEVAAGTHELQITYYVIRSSLETVLATVTKNVIVRGGESTPVTITENELERNFDSDGDGFTNLAEVRSNTDPYDNADSPGSPPSFAVGHGSFGDAASTSYAAKSIVGEAATGRASSTNYRVTTGFTKY